MFAAKEKSDAEISPDFATRTARPVIPPNVKNKNLWGNVFFGKLKKINPYGHDQGGRCHHKEAVYFRFHLFFPPYRIVTPQSGKVNYL